VVSSDQNLIRAQTTFKVEPS